MTEADSVNQSEGDTLEEYSSRLQELVSYVRSSENHILSLVENDGSISEYQEYIRNIQRAREEMGRLLDSMIRQHNHGQDSSLNGNYVRGIQIYRKD